jgi:hypothetical protein
MRRLVLPLLAAAALLDGCGSDPAPQAPPSAATAERALSARLTAKSLSTHSITCVDGGVRRGSETVFRCNVNFGEPHIEGYCVIVRDGRAVTQFEDPSLHCRRTRTGDEP